MCPCQQRHVALVSSAGNRRRTRDSEFINALIRDDLPLPTGPMTMTRSPWLTSSEMLFKAGGSDFCCGDHLRRIGTITLSFVFKREQQFSCLRTSSGVHVKDASSIRSRTCMNAKAP